LADKSTYAIPMHREGRVVDLLQILRLVNGQLLTWRLTEIEAIVVPGSALDIVELEREALSSPDGISFSNRALTALADQLLQVINCDLSGYLLGDNRKQAPVVLIRALDSTEWSVAVDQLSIAVDHNSPLLH